MNEYFLSKAEKDCNLCGGGPGGVEPWWCRVKMFKLLEILAIKQEKEEERGKSAGPGLPPRTNSALIYRDSALGAPEPGAAIEKLQRPRQAELLGRDQRDLTLRHLDRL